jgi:hypothetical protein
VVDDAKVNVVKPELEVAVRVAVPPEVAVDGALKVIVCWVNAGGVELPPPQAERINADAAAPASRVNELREICTMLPPMAFEKEMDGRSICESAV